MSETAQPETIAAGTAPVPQDAKDPQVDFTTGDDERDPEEAMLQAELERQERELREMQALHDNISGAKPVSASTSGDNVGASSSGTAMDTAQDGEVGDNAEQEEVDGRSVFVGNVDYGATPEEIQQHFQACGAINRVTILCDKFTGHPKGYAYVEFAEPTSVNNALVLNESSFRSRQLQVCIALPGSPLKGPLLMILSPGSFLQVTPKRTNKPAFMLGRGRGRGRPYRGGYRGSGGYAPYRARGRGRGRGH
ncbi:hypothetical protein QFC19_004717 [Naganishia cerealis]|uniref:Uncharacterized protein n=1 Tax=Naganishia cerealis TaxID=610337 RepID=A0ACC2VT90_9TREE|nr:hypothetical protein QFC19_004717 [Naganishia cerealis]